MSQPTLLADIFEALPIASFLVDADGTVLLANQLGRGLVHETAEGIAADPRRAGTLLHCVHAENDLGGCGRGPACATCDLRGVVGEALKGGKAAHRQLTLTLRDERGGPPHAGAGLGRPHHLRRQPPGGGHALRGRGWWGAGPPRAATGASRTARTLASRTVPVKGFCRRSVRGSRPRPKETAEAS